ncbi:MAG: adenosine kinase [Bacteroidales bacterium]|nr:adenosine kinase [Bacteroidales bacterium]MBR5652178.1 adenosine kinase [Bacteroidales bacterium]
MKIIGIGNALTDIIVPIKDYEIIDSLNIPHGGMVMIDKNQFLEINKHIAKINKSMVAGGSAANTIYGLSKLGVETSFIGKVGMDTIGDNYEQDMLKAGIKPDLIRTDTPSGCAIVLITPDGERTFASYLGAAQELMPENISEENFRGHDILHIEGYLLFNYDIVLKAMQTAKKLGMKVSLDLAAHNFVEENRPIIKDLIRNYVDVCFANEEESKAVTGLQPREALDCISEDCDFTVVKLGSKGSLIKHNGTVYEVGTPHVECVDSTGAGDLYASGLLYGIAKGYNAETCGKIGAIIGSIVIQNYGARISDDNWETIRQKIDELV